MQRAAASARVMPSVLPVLRAPVELLRLPISAYRPTLKVMDDAVYLLTEHAAYRVAAGGATQRFDLELGVGATVTDSWYVFWSDGAVQRAPKLGGKAQRVFSLPEAPQYFVGSRDDFAWLARSRDGGFSIQIPTGNQPKTLLSAGGAITALTLLQGFAFFVEASGGSWRIGAVREPGSPKYAAVKSGRPPSMLVTDGEALFYYDGERSQIVKLAPDLQSERVWVGSVICSPIAVAGAAYCGSVEGLYSVSQSAPAPHMLSLNQTSLVTALSADKTRVAWLRDTGPEQLSLELLETGER